MIEQATAIRSSGVPLQIIAIAQNAQAIITGADQLIDDTTGRIAAKYGIPRNGAYLVRPDQHICARWLQVSAAQLQSAIDTALGKH